MLPVPEVDNLAWMHAVAKLTRSIQFSAHIEPNGTIINDWISQSLVDVLGYSTEQMTTMLNWEAIIHPDDVPIVRYQLREVLAGRESVAEYRAHKADGTLCWLRSWVTAEGVRPGERVQRLYGAVQEITRQVKTELSLRASEMRLKNLLLTLPINLFTIDTNGIVTFSDGSSSSRMGIAHSDMPGMSVYELFADQPDYLEDTRQVLEGKVIECERFYRDGVFQSYYAPLYDSLGHMVGAIGIDIDITERKRMEQAMIETQSLRAALRKEFDLSELKSKMMQRIAHEFRTPLATIQLSAQMLERYGTRMSDADKTNRITQILGRVTHLTHLLDDISLVLQAKSHTLALNRYRFNLNEMCAALIDELRTGAGTGHVWRMAVSEEAQIVNADARLIGLMLQNLLSNAVKYSAAGTIITLSARMEGERLILMVEDQGIGILPDEQARVFEPFFRGSNFDERPGLGLGLSIVNDAVSQHEGCIDISSIPGEGTLFTVSLPTVSAKPQGNGGNLRLNDTP